MNLNTEDNMGNNKGDKRKIVEAHPQVGFLGEILIKGKEEKVPVGGFSIDGGFYLREGFDLVKKKDKNIVGEEITYFNFVKIPKKKGVVEKIILKRIREEKAWEKKRKKELQKELDSLNKKNKSK